MPSLTTLVAARGPVLLVDSSSAGVAVAVFRAGAAPVWRQSAGEAGVALFANAAAALAEAGVAVRGVGAYVFCEGPGSILGIRTAAMALRTWQAAAPQPAPAFAYRSLELLAADLRAAGSAPPFAVIADARRETWHWIEVTAAGPGPLQRVTAAAVAAYAGGLFLPDGFRTWSPTPRAARSVPYAPDGLWARQAGAELLRPAAEPDAFLHAPAVYAAWTPRIHRAPRRQPS